MPRSHFVKKAQHDIYERGKLVKKTHSKGKHAGAEYEDYDRSLKGGKDDKVLVKKGEPYYWWQFNFRPKTISKVAPRRSQLTGSPFLSSLYDLEDEISEAGTTDPEELEGMVSGWVAQITDMKDECEEHLQNMPEQLQESDSGQTLQDRIDGLEQWISDLEAVDLDVDTDAIHADAKVEAEAEERAAPDSAGGRLEEDIYADKLQERIDEIINELQETSSNL
jgi:hypothetical protein